MPTPRSLPHRQLRKFSLAAASAGACSLPHRQLRKQQQGLSTREACSLPHRQLRNQANLDKLDR
ncbi:hypothetical protein [Vibrio cholerae]|nr:hypothetical protein [Vibrio cholerae]